MCNRLRVGLLLLSLFAFCNGDQWLMKGDFISEAEAQLRNLHLESLNSTTSVSSSMHIILASPPHHKINCVIAAAMHLNGDVSLVDGGVGSSTVTVAYETLNAQPDLFFVMIESHADKILRLGLDGIQNSRVSIFYDKFKDWGLTYDGYPQGLKNYVGTKSENLKKIDEN